MSLYNKKDVYVDNLGISVMMTRSRHKTYFAYIGVEK